MTTPSTPPRERRTLVEEGTELKGTMSSSCPIVVMGKVEGDIAGPSIEISATGVVAGTVKVKELRSEGELAGEITAETIHLSGRVRDGTVIRAETLEVQLGGEAGAMEVVFGVCELAIGDEPSKEAAIAAALAPPPREVAKEVAIAAAPVAASPAVAAEPPAAKAPEATAPEAAATAEAAKPADAAAGAKPTDPTRRRTESGWEMPSKEAIAEVVATDASAPAEVGEPAEGDDKRGKPQRRNRGTQPPPPA